MDSYSSRGGDSSSSSVMEEKVKRGGSPMASEYQTWLRARGKTKPRIKNIDLSTARDGSQPIYIEGDHLFIIRNDAPDLELAINEPTDWFKIPMYREGKGRFSYVGAIHSIYLKHSAVLNGILQILFGFPESIRDFYIETIPKEELYALRDRFIISKTEELLNVKVYSGSPKVELVTDLDPKTYQNTVGVRIRVPANSTVEVCWGKAPLNIEYGLHFAYWRSIDTGITYSIGLVSFTENGDVQTIVYQHTGLNGDGLFNYEQFNFIGGSHRGEVGFALKLQNTTNSELTALVTFINIFIIPPDMPRLYMTSIYINKTVTETTETSKLSFSTLLSWMKYKLKTANIYIQVKAVSDGVNTLTVNVYLNNKQVLSGSTTSSSNVAFSTNFNIVNKLKNYNMPIEIKAYITGGSGKIVSFIFSLYTLSEEVRILNKYSKTTYTGTANTTTTHDIWTWATKHYRIKQIKLTTDANVSSAYLYDSENALQISESIEASSSLILTDIKDIEALQLKMTSGASAGTCVIEIYYEEFPAMIV